MPPKDDYNSNGIVTSRRRRFLQGVGAVGLTSVLAGCPDLADDEPADDEPADDEPADDDDDDDPPAPEATFEIKALEPGDVTVDQGEDVTATATIENTGDGDGEQDIEFFFDGDSEEVTSLSLDAGAENDVSFDIDTADLEGDYDYEVKTEDDEALATLTVEPLDVLAAPWGLNVGGEPEEPQSDVPVVIDGLEFVDADDPEDIDYVTVTSGEVPEWAEDWFEPPAGVSDGPAEIEGTDYDALYQTEFHGPDLGFEIAIENGTYDVVLHYTEIADHLEEGDRVFDVSVQGETVAQELDIAAEVGHGTALTLVVQNVDVSGNELVVDSETHEDFTKICGIEIRETGDAVQAPYAFNANGNEGDFYGGAVYHTDLHDAIEVTGEENSADHERDEGVEGVDYDDLYMTEHWGEDLGYDIPIADGLYDVTLHWAETWFGEDGESGDGGEGSRVFDVSINGQTVLEEFDPYAEAGGSYIPATQSFTVPVSDELLSISTSTHNDNTMFKGVRVTAPDVLSAPYGMNLGGEPSDPQSDVPVVIDGLTFEDVDDADAIADRPYLDVFGDDVDEDWFTYPASVGGETGEEIADTDYDALYQTYLFGLNFGFEISIENGTYDVIFHNSENFQEAEGARVFDITVQGETVAEEYDVYAETGDQFVADTVVAEGVEVDDETLTIETDTHEDMSKFAAIEIREADDVDDDPDEIIHFPPIDDIEDIIEDPRDPVVPDELRELLEMFDEMDLDEVEGIARELLAEFGIDLDDVLAQLEAADIDSVEALLPAFEPLFDEHREAILAVAEDLLAEIEAAGLDLSSAHVPLDVLEGDLEAIAELAAEFEIETLIDPGFHDEELWESEEAILELAGQLEAVDDELDEFGIDLAYHTFGDEFQEVGDRLAFAVLAEQLDDVGLQLDVDAAMEAGVDPLELIDEYGDLIDSAHVDGDVDAETLAALEDADIELIHQYVELA